MDIYRVIGIRCDGLPVAIAEEISRDNAFRIALEMPLDDDPFCGIQIERHPDRVKTIATQQAAT